MKITDLIARKYDNFKEENDRYPKRILIGKEAFATLLKELQHSGSPDFIYRISDLSVAYQSVPVTKDESLGDNDISMG